jgi:hypothetical protein
MASFFAWLPKQYSSHVLIVSSGGLQMMLPAILTKCGQKYVLTGEATWFGNESNTESTGPVIPTALSRCYP